MSEHRANATLPPWRAEMTDEPDDGRLGHVDAPGRVVYLHKRHPRIHRHVSAANVAALADLAVWLIAQAESAESGEDLAVTAGRMMAEGDA